MVGGDFHWPLHVPTAPPPAAKSLSFTPQAVRFQTSRLLSYKQHDKMLKSNAAGAPTSYSQKADPASSTGVHRIGHVSHLYICSRNPIAGR